LSSLTPLPGVGEGRPHILKITDMQYAYLPILPANLDGVVAYFDYFTVRTMVLRIGIIEADVISHP
jgi:hypothetical protein